MNIPRECFASAARVPIMFTTCDCSRALARHSLATHSQLACDTRASVNLWVSGTVCVHVSANDCVEEEGWSKVGVGDGVRWGGM